MTDFQLFLTADANDDGITDGLDYLVWVDNLGDRHYGYRYGDFNFDTYIDGQDYTLWADHYGDPGLFVPTVSTPEPSTLLLMIVSLVILFVFYKRR